MLATLLIIVSIFTFQPDTTETENISAQKLEIVSEKVDSLQTEVEKHRIAEQYFTGILSDQTAIFSLIIAVIFTLLGLVAWGVFYKSFYGKLDNFEDRIKEIESHNYELRDDILFQASQSHYYNAVHMLREKSYAFSTIHYFVSLDYSIEKYQNSLEESDEEDQLKKSLSKEIDTKLGFVGQNIELINQIEEEDELNRQLESLGEYHKTINSIIDEILKLEFSDSDVFELVIDIKKDLAELMEEYNAEE